MDVSDAISQQVVTCGIDQNACSIAWSPDGARIAVAQAGRLELVDLDGDNRTVIHEEQGIVQRVWSPDGGRIAFQIIGGNPDAQRRRLVTIERDGSDRTELLGPLPGIGVWDPAWSPDGSTIAYLGSTHVRVCDGSSTENCQDEWDMHVMAIDLDALEPPELARAGRVLYRLCAGPGLVTRRHDSGLQQPWRNRDPAGRSDRQRWRLEAARHERGWFGPPLRGRPSVGQPRLATTAGASP